MMDKVEIIREKERGTSNREIAKKLKCDRKTVSKYWNDYQNQKSKLSIPADDYKEIQELITEPPKYDITNRKRRKFTEKMSESLNKILESETTKDKVLGCHKQALTKVQIHTKLKALGYEISLSTVTNEVNLIRNHTKECFIRQNYEFGDRLEYDFGEVNLVIDGIVKTYHMAVISSPGGNFRWSYLYKNQKKDVFLDSHVQFFDMVGGIYREVVYDNMKNVVSKFIGRNEKELNEDLIKMSIYYGFEINVTNCFSGNEKGYVESSVKVLRNAIFSEKYEFNSFLDAREYMTSRLIKFNENSNISEEKECLLPYKPKLEFANISENHVNSYSFVCVDNNFYSVPEYLVGKSVIVKRYYDKIVVFSNNSKVCEHDKLEGFKQIRIDIYHYLNTFLKKPGAVRNSLALKSIPELKEIYDKYYAKRPRKFIQVLIDNRTLEINEIVENFRQNSQINAIDTINSETKIYDATKMQLLKYNSLCLIGGK